MANSLFRATFLLLALASCLYLGWALICHESARMRQNEGALGQLCRNIFNIKQISQMEKLIHLLKEVIKGKDFVRHQQDAKRQSIWCLGMNFSLPCIEQADAIVDLENVIGERENICESRHIDKIDAYYRRYLSPDDIYTVSLTKKFFSLYANQVSFLCKSNLLKSLRIVDRQFFTQDDYNKVIPWILHSDDCRLPEELNSIVEPLIAGSSNGTSDQQQNLHCLARKALESSINSVNDLVEAFEHDASDEAPEQQLESNVANSKSTNLILVIPETRHEIVEGMLKTCKKFKLAYSHTVMPIVRLVQMGFDPSFKNFNRECYRSQLIQRWLTITLVCHSLLGSRLANEEYREFQNNAGVKERSLIIVDNGNADGERVEVDQIQGDQANAILNTLRNEIEDELWVYKYMPSRFSKIKSGILRKMYKIFNIGELDDHIVFRRRVADAKRYVVKLVLVGLALAGVKAI